jgi:predicted outer membrane repeat protein
MHCHKSYNKTNKNLLLVFKATFIALNLSFISFTAFAGDKEDKVVPLLGAEKPGLSAVRQPQSPAIDIQELTDKYLANPSLATGVSVGCSLQELTAAIIAGNTSGSALIRLPPACTFVVENPASIAEAFPEISGNITLIGDIGTIIVRDIAAAPFRIFTVNPNATLTLKMIKIVNGNTSDNGGAILVNGELFLEEVVLSHNNASNGGGIAISSGAKATLNKTTFLFNTTTGVGGGGILNFGKLNIENSLFSSNTATINGGAINSQAGSETSIYLTMITYNRAGGKGGALSNLGTINISESIINYNTGANGGGIATGNSNVTINQTSNMAILNNLPNNCYPLNTVDGCEN